MHNLSTIFAKFLEICKEFSKDLVSYADCTILDDRGYLSKNVIYSFAFLSSLSTVTL
jgi:hypothetical protein